MAETMLLRLISGEEIIAEVEKTENGYSISKPVCLIPTKDGNLGLTHWMPYAKILEISDVGIAFVGIPMKEMITQYDSVFSGLVVPQKGVVNTPDLKLTT